jgi:8-oxo-dGTP diphosphatase
VRQPEAEVRRYGDPPRPDKVYRRRPGAYGVLIADGAVLLTHQTAPEPEVQLPGGGIDPGESPVAALHREVFEETGWRIGQVRRLTCYRRFTFMPEYDLWAEKICLIYVARPVQRLGPPLEPDHSVLWAPLAGAAALLDSPGDRAVVADLIG